MAEEIKEQYKFQLNHVQKSFEIEGKQMVFRSNTMSGQDHTDLHLT